MTIPNATRPLIKRAIATATAASAKGSRKDECRVPPYGYARTSAAPQLNTNGSRRKTPVYLLFCGTEGPGFADDGRPAPDEDDRCFRKIITTPTTNNTKAKSPT